MAHRRAQRGTDLTDAASFARLTHAATVPLMSTVWQQVQSGEGEHARGASVSQRPGPCLHYWGAC